MSAEPEEKIDYGAFYMPDRFIIRCVFRALYQIKQGGDINEKGEGSDMKYLRIVLRDERWDLIEAAAKMGRLDRDRDTSERPRSDLKESAKWLAYELSDWGLDESGDLSTRPVRNFTKAEILEILRIQHPEEYATIPSSIDGQKLWWRDVGCEIDQSRGYETGSTKKLFENLKSGKIRW